MKPFCRRYVARRATLRVVVALASLLLGVACNPRRTEALPVAPDGFSALYFAATSPADALALTGNPISGDPKIDVVPAVNFSSAAGQVWAPVPDPNLFSARFTGKFRAPASGTFGFGVNADNGVRLWVDERLVIDGWQAGPVQTRTGSLPLTAGELYSIRLEYFHQDGPSVCALSWQVPGASLAVMPTAAVYSGERCYPAGVFGPHFRNVRDYGARGDGRTDDTAAIQAAIADGVGNGTTLYFPNGTYQVSGPLTWIFPDAGGAPRWGCFLAFQGESQGNVLLRLAPGAAAFQNAAAPAALIQTGDLNGTAAGVDAYLNNLRDFTLEIGADNPGACGIWFHGTNTSCLRRVTVRDAGNGALYGVMADFSAGVVQELTVQGFAYGVVPTQGVPVCQDYEYLTLLGQRCFGLELTDFADLSVRHLRSENTVPGIYQELGYTPAANAPKRNRGGTLVVTDSLFTGLAADGVGIDVDDAAIFARRTAAPGARNFIQREGTPVGGAGVDEYLTYPACGLFPAAAHSLDLPIKESPEFHDNHPANWVNAADFGAVADGQTDASPALQAAIDYAAAHGKTTVYLTPGASNVRGDYVSKSYVCERPVTVHGDAVRSIAGFGSQLRPRVTGGAASFPGPLFRLQNATAPVELDDLTVGTDAFVPGFVAFSHESNQPVVLREAHAVNVAQCYSAQPGASELYVDGSCSSGWCLAAGERAWLRGVNPESSHLTPLNAGAQIRNPGGYLWVAGMKSETTATLISTEAGGMTEVLGVQALNLYHAGDDLAANGRPVFQVKDGLLSATGETVVVPDVDRAAADQGLPNPHFSSLVVESRAGVARTLGTGTLPAATSAGGGRFNLYTDAAASAKSSPATSSYRSLVGDTFEATGSSVGDRWQCTGGSWSVAHRINPADTAVANAPDTVWSSVLQQGATAGHAAAFLRGMSVGDGRVECSLGHDPSSPGTVLSVMVRATDANNGYRLSFYQDGGGARCWSLDRLVAGQATTLSSGAWPFAQPDYVWYTLAVVQLDCSGSTITARVRSSESTEFVDLGAPVADATFATGGVGVCTEGGTGCFDNVYVFSR